MMDPRRRSTLTLVALASLAVGLGCGDGASPPPARVPAPVAVTPTGDAGFAAPVPDRASDAIRAALASCGALEGEPVPLGSGAWLGFVGSAQATDAACIVGPAGDAGAPKARRVALPPSSRVAFTLVDHGRAYAVVESVAALDLPAGLRTLVALEGEPEGARSVLERADLATARDAGELATRIAARPLAPPKQGGRGPDAILAALNAVKGSEELAGTLLHREGLTVFHVFGDTFVRRGETLDHESLPKSELGPALFAMAARTQYCSEGTCPIRDDAERLGQFHYVDTDVGARLRAVTLPSPRPALLLRPAPPRRVAAGDRLAAARAARRRGEAGEVLGAASLSADGNGTIGVLRSGGDLSMVLEEGSYADVMPLDLGPMAASAQVGFVDSDGDGRTDVVLFGESDFKGKKAPIARLFLSPREYDPSRKLPLRPDPASVGALRGAATLDAALAAALTVPTGAAPKSELCPVVLALGKAGTATTALAPGAKLFVYDEPRMAEVSLRAVPLAKVVATHESCEGIVCDTRRLACWRDDEPAFDWFTFARVGRALRLASVVRYRGT